MFRALTFAQILHEERLREYNKCHVPPGSPAGGQFCSSDTPDEAYNRANPTRNRGESTVIAARAKELAGELAKGGAAARAAKKELALYPADSEMHRYVGDERFRQRALRKASMSTLEPAESPYSGAEQAQRSPDFKGTTLGFWLAHAVTDYDQRQYRRRSRSYFNPNALPLYLEAATRADKAVTAGTPLEQALAANFEGPLLKHVTKYLLKKGIPKGV